ncbi:MAG: DUF1232 domain-containing protein [Desulfovibrio sp.]|nr:DUF1232 domain-containing protein [Desulfovibrio sp.]
MNIDQIFKKIDDYAQHFSDRQLWEKIARMTKKVGYEVLRSVLILYYTLENPELPGKVRAVILGALGYFILPVDLIPDFIPIVGMSDDIAIVAAAIAYASLYITQEAKDKAEAKLKMWFK